MYYYREQQELEDIIDSLLQEDPTGNSYSFCYCGCPASEHQDADKFCFNCGCMKFIPVECEVV